MGGRFSVDSIWAVHDSQPNGRPCRRQNGAGPRILRASGRGSALSPACRCVCGAPSARLFLVGLLCSRAPLRFTGRDRSSSLGNPLQCLRTPEPCLENPFRQLQIAFDFKRWSGDPCFLVWSTGSKQPAPVTSGNEESPGISGGFRAMPLFGWRDDDPDGIRTRVAALKGPCPRPLDDRAMRRTIALPA